MNTPFTPKNLRRSISAYYVKTIFAMCFVTLISLKSVAQFNTTCQYIISGPAGGTTLETGGTGLVLTDDQLSGAIPIGFNFQFYGVTYSNLYISSNGFISFDAGAGNGCCSGQFLPSTAAPNNLIAAYWEDLNPSLGGTITYFTTGTFPNRRFVVYFNNIPHHPGGNAVSFEIKLFETSNVISILNISCPSDGGIHTEGIEDNTGTIALVPSGRNSSNFSSFNETVTFTPIDNIVPTITCPANITVNADPGGCTAVVSYAPTVSDNCSVARVSTIAGLASGSSFPTGTTNITLRARDDGSAGLFSNGAGGTFTFNEGDNAQTIAFRACESYNGVGNCAIGSCGSFTYYYRGTDPSCTCGKSPGQYEWVYSNSGYTDVGQDYGGTNAALPGTIPFCRVKGEAGCSVPNTWLLANNNLGGNQNTCNFSVTVNGVAAPTSATVTPSSSCGPTTAQLNAISAGNNINWYTVPTGGTSIGSSASGANFAVSPSATTTYYAEANTIPTVVPTRTFTQSFVNGVAPTTQCTAWTSFLASLTGTYTKMVINSDLNAGITLTDPTTVNAIATAMRTGATLTTTFGGNTYYVGYCGSGIELAVNAGSICNCSNAISVRPCIGNANWGGVNTATCNGPTQTITVQFSANAEIYTQSFGSGLAPTFQCTEWTSFQSSLTGTYSQLILSSNLSGGITLTDPTTVNAIANAIRTGTSLTTSFGGNTYYVGSCGGVEFAVNSGGICGCSSAYSLRPCIGNSNWGGVNSATCGGPTQTISLQFTRQAVPCSSASRTPVVFTFTTPASAPTTVIATPNVVCGGSTVQLNATSAGGSINWYTVPTGGTTIGSSASGANFSVSPTTTTTYYAEASGYTVAPGSTTFIHTGGAQTFVVPAGVTTINVDASGASGMTSISGAGGLGGRVQATLPVTPGSTINVYVGGQGLSCNTGGFNGGAITSCVYAGSTYQGTGGGASDLRIGGTALSNRVLVAGGGGGAAYNYSSGMQGGNGGGLVALGGQGGGAGSVPGGGGGTQIAGGIAGVYAGYTSGQPGTLGVGGVAGAGTGGGGGGGGYYGGGGGSWGGGGGGSSYTDPSASGVVHTQGSRSGDGIITISWGGTVCASATRTPVVVTSLTPSTPTAVIASPSTACNGSTVQLNATSAGNTINWYTVPTAGTSIGSSASGANFAVSPSGTTTYYAEAVLPAVAPGSTTFNYTGGAQTFTVPAGVTSLTVDAYGAQGGSPNTGALGGRMQSTVTVVPGQTINIYVGGQGLVNTGGFNGGGGVQGGTSGAFGGGGASDIRIGGTALSNRVVVAGGGGGTGAAGCCGGPAAGVGGGTTGGTGSDCWLDTRGFGGSQIAGGLGSNTSSFCGGSGSNGASGSLGQGGGGGSTACCTPSSINGGGGGGGGYYGGGGSSFGGAGGGSSFSSGAILTNSQGVRSGNGMITISWAGVASCVNPTRTPVVFTSLTPSAPTSVTASPSTACVGSTVQLNATSAGNTINWYTVPTAGTSIGSSASGANFAVSPSGTTTYYAEAAASNPTPGSSTFNFTGGLQTFTVPAGVTSLTVDAYGAQGGSPNTGALGGRMQSTVTVIPGQTINIYVGGQGLLNAGGFNGGGGVQGGTSGAFGGGGASDIRIGGTALSNRVVVAGGGGGTGAAGCCGGPAAGVGGGTTGGTGSDCWLDTRGFGGSQIAGGLGSNTASFCGGSGSNGASGSLGQGGAGGSTACCTPSTINGGGGGGGGYFGGGGSSFGGAGGGSSFSSGTILTNSQGVRTGNGMITISWTADAPCLSATRTPVVFTANVSSVAPTGVTGTLVLCTGSTTNVVVAGGTKGTGAVTQWFTGSCGGTLVGSGDTIALAPTATTTYFVRYAGTCNTTTCASFTITVNPYPIASISPPSATFCTPTAVTLTASGATSSTLAGVLSAINSNSAALIASIPSPSGFNMDMGVNATFISDGCSDMYDGGNLINTNLASSISYSDNTVISSASFGTGGQYFTRYLGPGGCQTGPATIFYMAADVSGLSTISITGDNGADGAGTQELATFNVSAAGVTYTCFLKRVYGAGDPSINQIFMIPQPNSASQAMGSGTNDGLHTISNLTGVTRIYYMLYAGASGGLITTPQATTIAQTFANIIPSAGTYSWSTGATTAPITVTPSSTTTYTCTVTNLGCSTPVSATVTINTPSVAPTSITGTTTICNGASTTLTLSGGTAGTGATAEWFTGSCGGTAAGIGNSITVSPTTTTTYFVRYNGTCNTTTCASVTVTVNSPSIAPSSITGTTTICSGASTTLTLSGGTAGTGATAEWFSGSCGGTPEGIGNSITVSPTSTTTYFVRYNGTCNTTTCASATVTVNSLSIAATSTTSTPDHGCEGSSITLTAAGFTAGTGATPIWWTGAGGTGVNVGAGTPVVTTIISPTYYLRLAGTCNAVESVVNIAMGGPSNVVLASGPSTNPISYCEDGLWSYYEHPSLPGKFVFAIKWGTTNAAAKAAAQVFISNNAINISNEATRSGGIKDASYVMKRYWNVDIGGNTLVDPVDIKFFYDPSEISSITADRDAQMGALNAITPGRYFPVSFSWFKTVGAPFTPSLINDGNNFAFSYIPLVPATTGTENGVSFVEFDGIASFSGGSGGIGFSPHASTPLPVTYTTISAKPIANEFIQVAWVCASEINNRGFDVLRSLDGINFEKIGFVSGSNNSSTARAYHFDDYNVVAGREYYYRLNQMDYDGKSEKSAIVSAHLISAQNSIGEFYPNPTKDITSIDIYVTAANTSSIRLVDAIGQEVLKVDNDLNIGLNKVSLNTNQLAAGMYIAYILVGSEVAQKTIVVTK